MVIIRVMKCGYAIFLVALLELYTTDNNVRSDANQNLQSKIDTPNSVIDTQ